MEIQKQKMATVTGRKMRARLQYTAGATYKKDKLTFDMEWFVTAKREMAYYNYEGNTKYQDHRVPDKIDLNLTMQYDINPEDTITLGGYNLLDRDNQIDSTEYYLHLAIIDCLIRINSNFYIKMADIHEYLPSLS